MRSSLSRLAVAALLIACALSPTFVFPQADKKPAPRPVVLPQDERAPHIQAVPALPLPPPLVVPAEANANWTRVPETFPPVNLAPPLPPPIVGPARAEEIRYLRKHDVEIDYEMRRVGPSGLGAIQVWISSDGKTWSAHAEIKNPHDDPVGRSTKSLGLRDENDEPLPDGQYGLTLSAKNRAGVGRTPKTGDAPQLRFVIDTKAPEVQIFQPIADPKRPGNTLLKWSARDEHLADTPIEIEYAEKRDGPWLPFSQLGMEGRTRVADDTVTGEFTFKSELKDPVYLRMRVKDKAGNEGVAATTEPVWLDFTEPEGGLVDIRAK